MGTTISLCHGPNALRSAALAGDFPYSGYKIRMFPDSVDDQSPQIGYLPGSITEAMKPEVNVKALGVQVENTAMDGSVQVDRVGHWCFTAGRPEPCFRCTRSSSDEVRLPSRSAKWRFSPCVSDIVRAAAHEAWRKGHVFSK